MHMLFIPLSDPPGDYKTHKLGKEDCEKHNCQASLQIQHSRTKEGLRGNVLDVRGTGHISISTNFSFPCLPFRRTIQRLSVGRWEQKITILPPTSWEVIELCIHSPSLEVASSTGSLVKK